MSNQKLSAKAGQLQKRAQALIAPYDARIIKIAVHLLAEPNAPPCAKRIGHQFSDPRTDPKHDENPTVDISSPAWNNRPCAIVNDAPSP